MDADKDLREHLVHILEGSHAHPSWKSVLKNFPLDRIGEKPPGSPHSAWELFEHMRIAQWDILRFSQSAGHVSPKFPEGYWPKEPQPQNQAQWDESLRSFEKDLEEFIAMVRDPRRDLNSQFPWGDGQNLLREALVLADHNSYHLGQLVLVRKLLGVWSE
jgi:hypothetical protein